MNLWYLHQQILALQLHRNFALGIISTFPSCFGSKSHLFRLKANTHMNKLHVRADLSVPNLRHHEELHFPSANIPPESSHSACVWGGFYADACWTRSCPLQRQSCGEAVSSGNHVHQRGPQRGLQVCPEPHHQRPPACSGERTKAAEKMLKKIFALL